MTDVSAWPMYERSGLHVAIYDGLTARTLPGSSVDGDVEYYLARAAEAGGPVLELGCGSGRVAWALAEAGHEVVGLDASPAMLTAAGAKAAHCASDTCARAAFVAGDMAGFALGRRFGLVVAPFRSFMNLLEPQDQRTCLRAIQAHLRPGGMLVLDLFDPRLDWCVPGSEPAREAVSVAHPVSGRPVRVDVVERELDPLRQRLREVWRFAEVEVDDTEVRVERELLTLRWTYRQEMRYLLELEGFTDIEEMGGFHGQPPAYGAEQVWTARRA